MVKTYTNINERMFLATIHEDYVRGASLWNQAASTMTWYPTQSHYPDNEPTSPRHSLIILSTWLGREKYKFLRHSLDLAIHWGHRLRHIIQVFKSCYRSYSLASSSYVHLQAHLLLLCYCHSLTPSSIYAHTHIYVFILIYIYIHMYIKFTTWTTQLHEEAGFDILLRRHA